MSIPASRISRSAAVPLLLLVVPLAAPGCNSTENEEIGWLQDFAGRLVNDLDEVDGNVNRIGEHAQEVPDTARGTLQECYPILGGCSLCYDFDGGPLSGTFVVAPDDSPCEITATRRELTATYTVVTSELTGSYTGTLAGDYTIEATGARAASLTVETSDDTVDEYTADFEITAFSAETEDGAVDSFEISMTYGTFADDSWEVEVAASTTGVLGTVTSTSGAACTVDGTFDDVSVNCTTP